MDHRGMRIRIMDLRPITARRIRITGVPSIASTLVRAIIIDVGDLKVELISGPVKYCRLMRLDLCARLMLPVLVLNTAGCGGFFARRMAQAPNTYPSRSEEHTSELQSRLHLVCR